MSVNARLDRFTPTKGQRTTAAALRDALRAPATSSALLLVTGEPGAGKSAMLAELMDDLTVDLAIGAITGDDAHSDGRLLRAMLAAFDEAPAGRSGLDLLTQLRAVLAAHTGEGRRPALIIDGAEALTGSQLEIVRSLLTPVTGTELPVAVVLAGRPELNERIRRRRPLARRRTHDLHLAGPDRDDLARILGGAPALADAVVAAARRHEVAPLALAGLLRGEAAGQGISDETLSIVLDRLSAGRPAAIRSTDAVQTAMPFAATPGSRNGDNDVRQLSLLHAVGVGAMGGDR